MALIFVIFMLFSSYQLVEGHTDHETYKLCLSCNNVRETSDCTHFVEIWSDEVCTTETVVLLNGTRTWNFGYEASSLCISGEFIRTERSLSRTRATVNERSGFVLCHECCNTDLCNHKLCGSSSQNALLCLNGEETRDRPPVSHVHTIAYCSHNESCYASNLVNFRPGHSRVKQYGCISKAVCRQFPATDYHGTCQRCCATDGCNVHLCRGQVSDSTTARATSHKPTSSPDFTTDRATSHKPTSSPDFTTDSTTSHKITNSPDSTIVSTTYEVAPTQATLYRDCWDLKNRSGVTESGVYVIYPLGGPAASLKVRCDMTTDGGGWTVFQRRFNGSVNFTGSMNEYEQGFGDVAGEHWLGLGWMHVLTTQGALRQQLRVDLSGFDGAVGYAVYDDFSISNRSDTYRLQIGTFRMGSKPIQDKLTYHRGHVFQTTGRCANEWNGGWWYGTCYRANLNGEPYNGGWDRGIIWQDFGGSSATSLKSSEMKFRRL